MSPVRSCSFSDEAPLETGTTLSQISAIEEENDELIELPKTMEQKTNTAKKRRILSVKSQEEDRASSNKDSEMEIERKQKQLVGQRQTTMNRKRQIELQRQETHDFAMKVSEYEAYVTNLEEQVNQYQNPIEHAVTDMDQSIQQLDNAVEYISPIKPR